MLKVKPVSWSHVWTMLFTLIPLMNGGILKKRFLPIKAGTWSNLKGFLLEMPTSA